MYLSRIKLNTSLNKTMRALVNPNIIHAALDSAEITGRTRKLWRIDSLNGNLYLLVLSCDRVDFSSVALQFGYPGEIETKDYSPLLDRVTCDSKWKFRLRANPTIKKFDAKKGKAVSLAHITTEYQMQWLIDRSSKNGFSVSHDEFMVTEVKWYSFKKKESGDNVRLLSVTYEGVLTVTDEALFKNMLMNGIGREKAYGNGMLTIVKC